MEKEAGKKRNKEVRIFYAFVAILSASLLPYIIASFPSWPTVSPG
ncbi:MAG: hypothetical protein WC770_07950 [Phycisphaerae bacterium]|jgi:hypothetical protein